VDVGEEVAEPLLPDCDDPVVDVEVLPEAASTPVFAEDPA
jgi:hypothetical protein